MPARDPHAVLGVEPDASQAQIKAAWRRLAREHHPDLATNDPAEARRATRRMAEINAAYQRLRDGDAAGTRAGRAGTAARDGTASGSGSRNGPGSGADRGGRVGGPPPPPRSRPVTGRLDTTDTIRPRNATTTHTGVRPTLAGQPGRRAQRERSEVPRASDPTGPLRRSRLRRFRPRPVPSLIDARSVELAFGKFRGHTLGEVEAFEPSYIDWLARTIDRDRDLVAAARAIQADLDTRGVRRRDRTADARRSTTG